VHCWASTGYPSYNSFGSTNHHRFKDPVGVCCSVANQCCQIFLGATYQKVGKYTYVCNDHNTYLYHTKWI
jgi:hypothetical protein